MRLVSQWWCELMADALIIQLWALARHRGPGDVEVWRWGHARITQVVIGTMSQSTRQSCSRREHARRARTHKAIARAPTYIHTYSNIHTHVYIHTYRHTCMHTYIHTHTHTYIHTYIHAYIHTHIQTKKYAHKRKHSCIYPHTCIHCAQGS